MDTDPSVYADPDGDGMPGLSAGASADFELTYAPMSEGTDEATVVFAQTRSIRPRLTCRYWLILRIAVWKQPLIMRCEGMLDVLTFCPSKLPFLIVIR